MLFPRLYIITIINRYRGPLFQSAANALSTYPAYNLAFPRAVVKQSDLTGSFQLWFGPRLYTDSGEWNCWRPSDNPKLFKRFTPLNVTNPGLVLSTVLFSYLEWSTGVLDVTLGLDQRQGVFESCCPHPALSPSLHQWPAVSTCSVQARKLLAQTALQHWGFMRLRGGVCACVFVFAAHELCVCAVWDRSYVPAGMDAGPSREGGLPAAWPETGPSHEEGTMQGQTADNHRKYTLPEGSLSEFNRKPQCNESLTQIKVEFTSL